MPRTRLATRYKRRVMLLKLLIYENKLIMFDQAIYANMTIQYNITPMRLIAFHRFNLYRSKYMNIILL
jgi:ABC-type antimicrobial peptide transport system ATPase subunit